MLVNGLCIMDKMNMPVTVLPLIHWRHS